MILGKIVGKTSTTDFQFSVSGKVDKFEYVQVLDKSNNYILCQVIELEEDSNKNLAFCNVIGYRDEEHRLRGLGAPLSPGTEVQYADDKFVKETLGLGKAKNSAFIGTLEGRENVQVFLDINKLLTKHVCVLAKSGGGKSYCVGALLEELLENNIPIVIIDPHGEYSTLKFPNGDDNDKLKKLGLKPKGYLNQVQEFSPDVQTNPECKPLKLSNRNLSPEELIHMLPAKLSNAQLGVMYSALKTLGNKADFDELMIQLENEDSSVKWTLINLLEYVKKLGLLSEAPTPLFELVKAGKASIINLKGVNPEVQEVVVYKIVKDMFMERKKGNIPPFFLVLEEGHNFIPERTYGETKSSGVLRQVFSEGRKFGLGVCLVSQRPSRVEKNALSQVNTQIILKVTNPNDVKAISSSVEGITDETEKEIKNIMIGTALVTGVVDLPVFVNIRPRRSKHGGAAVKILDEDKEEDKDFATEATKPKGELLPLIKQKVSLKDLKLMGKTNIKTSLVPCVLLSCSDQEGDFNILINLNNGQVVTDLESGRGVQLKGLNIESLSPQQKKVMKIALDLKAFKPAEIFSKSGLQFSDLYETIKSMTDKGFFVKSGDKYVLSEKLSTITNIRSSAFYGKIEYSSLDFDEKAEKKVETSSLVDFLGRFLTIKNEKECWLVMYEG
ncbi:ATP-binding protein [Candidatus Woesearchaeota archaeon]|nr:ATP-binding protein [Candidatus Woesearchaeota archaeon]